MAGPVTADEVSGDNISSCGTPLIVSREKPYEFNKGTERINGHSVEYLYTFDKSRLDAYSLNRIFTAPDDLLIIGFWGAHTFIRYGGYAIDSTGNVPFGVQSKVKRRKTVEADVLFAVKNVPPQSRARLDELLGNLKSRLAIDCTKHTCRNLNILCPELPIQSTIMSDRLFDELLQLKINQPNNFEIVLLNHHSLERERQRVSDETHVMKARATFRAAMYATPCAIVTVLGLLHYILH